MTLLEGGPLSAKGISGVVKIPEKAVYDHLEHIQRSLARAKDGTFVIGPPVCRKCGFSFKKRDRLRKPGRCPVCRGQSITDPLFTIQK